MSEVKGLRELAQQLAWSRMLSQAIAPAITRLIGRRVSHSPHVGFAYKVFRY